MTVDLLAATFWPEAAAFGARPPHHEPPPVSDRMDEQGEAATPAEGFWAALARRLWPSPDVPAGL